MEEQKTGRAQFTFYRSFREALRRIKKASDRARAYDMICDYALYGTEPELDQVSDAVAIAFINMKPNLLASRRKANAGKTGGSAKQTASKKETEIKTEIETEIETETETEHECEKDTGFAFFWEQYPNRRGGKDAAKKEWDDLGEEQHPQILQALDAFKASVLWQEQEGKFVPGAAKFLSERHWEKPPAVHMPSGNRALDEAELAAIRRLMGT